VRCGSVLRWLIAEHLWRFAIFCTAVLSMAFKPPSPEARCDAVGDLAGLPALLQRAFAADDAAFDPIPSPRPDDWLAVHPEPGQTFDQFKASRPNRPTESRHIIYLQPLGEFVADRSPSVEKM